MPDIILATINAKWIHPSLALRLLKANLGDLENSCEILEFALRQPLEEKFQPILAARPRVLGLSVSIWNHKATLELLDVLAKKWASVDPSENRDKPIVVLGGAEISWLPMDAEIFRHADYVIRGEAEERFRQICRRIFGLENTADEHSPHITADAVDVSAIAPAYHFYTDEDLQKKLVYVEASRGCAFGCSFCQGSIAGGGKVREFPLEPFLADMEKLIKRGAKIFKFLDRSFNLNIERASAIMEFFLERIAPEKEEGSAATAPPFCVHFEMVPFRFPETLKKLICRFPPGSLRLEVGIQTLNPQTATLIHRAGSCENGFSAEIEALKFLSQQTNAIIHADLIAGLPGEDRASFGMGFDRLWQALSRAPSGYGKPCAGAFEIQLGILKCLPGTAIARHSEACGIRYAPEPPYEVIETAALSAADLGRIKNFARFWEIIVNRNPFPDLLPRILPPAQPVFDRFMLLSDELFEYFGRNWGIDRSKLRAWLNAYPVPGKRLAQCCE
ncbi:MAG: DUF4080 domain-containing protein [Treponema sp.]|nr:DUF4080 domain-containing protein [Treponema sp.]